MIAGPPITRADLEAAVYLNGHDVFECARCGRTVPAAWVGPHYTGPYPAAVLPDGRWLDSNCWLDVADEVGI